jgi:hypothetical protein
MVSGPDDFTLKLANEAGTLNVELTDSTIIFIGCDEPFEDEIIPVGYKARVFGKFEAVKASSIYRAIVVFLQPAEPARLLTDISKTDNGYMLTIETDEKNTIDVFLPEDAPVKLKGDGYIDIFRLNEWVECHDGVEVEIELDPAKSDPLTAEKLLVLPDEIYAVVENKSNSLRILSTDEGDIAVEDYATIFKIKNDQHKLIEFEDIKIGDEFVAYGIEACPDDTYADFYGFILFINKPDSPGDDGDDDDDDDDDCNWMKELPGYINDNNVKICLISGSYEENLTVNGNNFELTGEARKKCSKDKGWTIIDGNVRINGNNAIFENIKFNRDVEENGNNTRFINCCF